MLILLWLQRASARKILIHDRIIENNQKWVKYGKKKKKSLRNIVRDKKVEMVSYKRTFDIPIDEDGQARGGNDYYCGF